jgi:hypothetical protein
MHVGARYYDAQVGRFITRDTVLSEHPYLYCEHEPVNHIDPEGHQRKAKDWWDWFWGSVGAGVGGIIGGAIGGGAGAGAGGVTIGPGLIIGGGIGAGTGAVIGLGVGDALWWIGERIPWGEIMKEMGKLGTPAGVPRL